jgi:ferredoxin-type protein NapH
MPKSLNPLVARRRMIQWILVSVVIVTLALGWKYPILGFSVPIVMLTGFVGSLFKGRYVCGNLCPRGGFFDRMIATVSFKKPIPTWLRKMHLRWVIFVSMMSFMVWRLSQNPGDWHHWGKTFWMMCIVTTAIGVVLGVLFHQRMWCEICPMGTMQNAIGGHKQQLLIDASKCRMCRICEKACPIQIPIVKDKDLGYVSSRDCLKCPECTAVCPTKALYWPQRPGNSLNKNE